MTEESKWSELPVEILELILKRLASADILRFEHTCSSWRLGAKSYVASPRYNPLPQTPWLMLYNDQDDNSFRLFSLEEKRVYTIKNAFDGFHGDYCCVGCSHGWLAIMDEKAVLNLLNPISRASIRLPDIQTPRGFSDFSRDNILKIIISSDPSRNNNCIMAMLATQPTRVGFYKHGDQTWRSLASDDVKTYVDIVFYHEQLYALTCTGKVEVWDFRKLLPVKTSYLLQNSGVDYCTSLVASLGDILKVQRIFQRTLYGKSYIISHFLVYKMNLTTARWEKVENLGDRILFWGRHQSITSSALEFTELKENSIYHYEHHAGHNVGVYSLEDKVVKPFYKFDKWKTDRAPFWFVPNLQSLLR